MSPRFQCFLLTIWFTVRYPEVGLFTGRAVSGHDLAGNGEVCEDHWHVVCRRCGFLAASEVDPSRWEDDY